MKSFGTLLAASILSVSVGTAWAANSNSVSGTIESIDPQSRKLVLDDGKTYTVASNVTLQGLEPGDKVKVGTEKKNGQSVIDRIVQTGSAPAQASGPTTPE